MTQRELARRLDVSLGTAHGLLKECVQQGLIQESGQGERKRWELLPAEESGWINIRWTVP